MISRTHFRNLLIFSQNTHFYKDCVNRIINKNLNKHIKL